MDNRQDFSTPQKQPAPSSDDVTTPLLAQPSVALLDEKIIPQPSESDFFSEHVSENNTPNREEKLAISQLAAVFVNQPAARTLSLDAKDIAGTLYNISGIEFSEEKAQEVIDFFTHKFSELKEQERSNASSVAEPTDSNSIFITPIRPQPQIELKTPISPSQNIASPISISFADEASPTEDVVIPCEGLAFGGGGGPAIHIHAKAIKELQSYCNPSRTIPFDAKSIATSMPELGYSDTDIASFLASTELQDVKQEPLVKKMTDNQLAQVLTKIYRQRGYKFVEYDTSTQEVEIQKFVIDFTKITKVAGTSAGAIAALIVTLRYTNEEIDSLMASIDFSKVDDGGNLISKGVNLYNHLGAMKGEELFKIIKKVLTHKKLPDTLTFNQLVEFGFDIDLHVTTARMQSTESVAHLKEFYFCRETAGDTPIVNAILASASATPFFPPILLKQVGTNFQIVTQQIEGENTYPYTDGGWVNNIPVKRFDADKYGGKYGYNDKIIGIVLVDSPVKQGRPDTTQPIDISNIAAVISALIEADRAQALKLSQPSFRRRCILVDRCKTQLYQFVLSLAKIDELSLATTSGIHKFLGEKIAEIRAQIEKESEVLEELGSPQRTPQKIEFDENGKLICNKKQGSEESYRLFERGEKASRLERLTPRLVEIEEEFEQKEYFPRLLAAKQRFVNRMMNPLQEALPTNKPYFIGITFSVAFKIAAVVTGTLAILASNPIGWLAILAGCTLLVTSLITITLCSLAWRRRKQNIQLNAHGEHKLAVFSLAEKFRNSRVSQSAIDLVIKFGILFKQDQRKNPVKTGLIDSIECELADKNKKLDKPLFFHRQSGRFFFEATVKRKKLDGCDLFLTSIQDRRELTKERLREAREKQMAIFIKHNGKFEIYGDVSGYGDWKYTKIPANDVFNQLPFDDGVLRRGDPLFTYFLVEKLKKGHAKLFTYKFPNKVRQMKVREYAQGSDQFNSELQPPTEPRAKVSL